MARQTSSHNAFFQFLVGLFFGVVLSVLVSAASTFYLQGHHYCSTSRFSTGLSNCIPAFEYALLRAASWGPTAIAVLAGPGVRLTQMVIQITSAVILGIISGFIFVFQSDKSPFEIFAVVYVILIALTAFLVLIIITAG